MTNFNPIRQQEQLAPFIEFCERHRPDYCEHPQHWLIDCYKTPTDDGVFHFSCYSHHFYRVMPDNSCEIFPLSPSLHPDSPLGRIHPYYTRKINALIEKAYESAQAYLIPAERMFEAEQAVLTWLHEDDLKRDARNKQMVTPLMKDTG